MAKLLQKQLKRSDIPVLAATGRNFADGVTAGPAAIVTNAAIILVDPGRGSAQSIQNFLKGRRVDAVGGPAGTTLKKMGIKPRVTNTGKDRYDTASLVAKNYFPKGTRGAYLASGAAFPDALTAGVGAGLEGSPLLLTTAAKLPQTTINSLRTYGTSRVDISGGTGAVYDAVMVQLRNLR